MFRMMNWVMNLKNPLFLGIIKRQDKGDQTSGSFVGLMGRWYVIAFIVIFSISLTWLYVELDFMSIIRAKVYLFYRPDF